VAAPIGEFSVSIRRVDSGAAYGLLADVGMGRCSDRRGGRAAGVAALGGIVGTPVLVAAGSLAREVVGSRPVGPGCAHRAGRTPDAVGDDPVASARRHPVLLAIAMTIVQLPVLR
jgi:hypothetical protein